MVVHVARIAFFIGSSSQNYLLHHKNPLAGGAVPWAPQASVAGLWLRYDLRNTCASTSLVHKGNGEKGGRRMQRFRIKPRREQLDHPHAHAAYRVYRLDDGAYGVEV